MNQQAQSPRTSAVWPSLAFKQAIQKMEAAITDVTQCVRVDVKLSRMLMGLGFTRSITETPATKNCSRS